MNHGHEVFAVVVRAKFSNPDTSTKHENSPKLQHSFLQQHALITMASEYVYDEDGESWPFFILAILSFILVPLTFRWVHRVIHSRDLAYYNSGIKGSIIETASSIGVENVQQIKAHQAKQKSSKIFNKTLLVLIIGWALVIYVALYVTKDADLSGAFDPYTILDISAFASEKEIKSKYKRLSLKFHPDKLPKDLTEKARDEMEAAFIRITLAYKSLTDEVTRNNFLTYGNPDGPQDITHGIAIPKFLVEGKYSPVMILVYFLLIGVLLPFIVGSWWSDVKSHTRMGLHVDTAALYARKLTDRNPAVLITPLMILDWVCLSHEIKTTFKHLNYNQVKDLISKHMNRDFGYVTSNPSLEADKVKLISMLPKLINGLIDIAVVFRQTEVVISAGELQKSIVQGVKSSGKHQEILQLPYVDPQVVEKSSVKKLGKLFTLNEEEQKKALGIKDSAKLKKALEVAAHIPSLRVIESDFVVPGEEVVPPSSQAHLALKFLIKGARLKSSPEIDEERLKVEETMDYLRDPFKSNEEQPPLPFAYAPYFPGSIRNAWTGYLISQKDNRLSEGTSSYLVQNVDLSNLELTQEKWKDGKEDVTIGTFNIKLEAPTPPMAGSFHFRVILKNNAYFGCDVDLPVELLVEDPPQKPIMNIKQEDYSDDDESDISDPEEDSLAAALASLRGDASAKKEDDGEESDNESIFTDINTDTEDEAED